MADIVRPERLQIMLTGAELRALDDWRFARRMPSRAAAIRELLRRGLDVEGAELAQEGRHSASFGVLSDQATADRGS
jgi:metal-responsive CopG/Arc/MetJ family transcriptional regulator